MQVVLVFRSVPDQGFIYAWFQIDGSLWFALMLHNELQITAGAHTHPNSIPDVPFISVEWFL